MPFAKMSFSLLKLSLVGLLVWVAFASFSPFASAQSSSAGIGIVPAVLEPKEIFDPGKSFSSQMEIKNLSESDQTYYLHVRDIVDAGPDGAPIFAKDNEEKTEFEMSRWVVLSDEVLEVPANGSKTINFSVTIPENATPGFHFGSISISTNPPDIEGNGAAVSYQVSSIMVIRVTGELQEAAEIRQFSTEKYFYGSKMVKFLARVENKGNSLIRPVGPVVIKNMFGKTVETLSFNESGAGVFPYKTREFYLDWKDENPGFGRYEAELSLVYGVEGSKKTMTSTTVFWILPMNIILPALIALLVIFLAIYIGVRVYIKRTLNIMTAGSSRRLVRSRKQGQFPTLLVFVTMMAVTALFLIILLFLFS